MVRVNYLMLDTNIKIRDFSIVVVKQNQSPSILNPDFLKYNKIIPPDWELAMPSISIPSLSQIIFSNGVNIVDQLEKISFWEVLDAEYPDFKVPDLTVKYIDAVPFVAYKAIGLNINAYFFLEEKENSQDIILDKLIAPGKWKVFQGESPNALVQFTYKFDNTNLIIAIQETTFQQTPNDLLIPIVNFTANFHRDLKDGTPNEKNSQTKNIIQAWKTDLNTLLSFVKEAFIE